MMKINKYLVFGLLIGMAFTSCKSDDDGTPPVPLRDEAEVAAEDDTEIREFLETHFYEMVPNPLNANYQIIQFDTIAGENSEKEPIMDSEFLKTKIIAQNEVDYTLYYLKIREGAPTKPKPTFADLVVVTYRGQLLDLTKFDESVSPVKFNLPGDNGLGGLIQGFIKTLVEFRGASESTKNPDNTIEFSDDFGIGAAFIPSGLAYFASPPTSTIPQYAPLIFTFQVYETVQGDPDGDGIPSIYEDLDGNGLLTDDSDADGVSDFLDTDDDGDRTLTADEIIVEDINEDGYITENEITLTDSNSDGTPDYLDPEVK